MHKNKIIIYGTILIIILLISIPSTIKTVKKHNDRLESVVEKKIIETAQNCYYNDSCVNETITLAELYEKMNLEEMTNPITKQIYNENSYVDVKDNFKFVEIKEK